MTTQYATLVTREHKGRKGALLKISNPCSKVDTLPFEALKEIRRALDDIHADSSLDFAIFYGEQKKIHAGADISLFAGDIDPLIVHDYLMAGADLDLSIKSLGITTVAIMQGECYGGSVEWPLMAERRVCTPETAMQFSEVNIGLIPGWCGALNMLLRSNKENALYLAATGNRASAEEMLAAGIVSRICPEDSVMEGALDVANAIQPTNGVKTLSTLAETRKVIAARTDAQRYQALSDEISQKKARGELSNDKKADNHIGKYATKRLNELGRPVAPLAVSALFKLIEKYANISLNDAELIREMAHYEAELCFQLMSTADRRTGINSILANDPVIPVYIGK
ncbi:MAG: hypothetical protein A3K09_04540 [Nitrospinae bacterium RIFCSPLOWO2_12_FULL_47_7]|nr:MAG: hypothetical protein A3K09_04540 [Nitrospinae bacterium RIFCSPLOWO2_12_FULL_47_7]